MSADRPEARLEALGIVLPPPPPGVGRYIPARRYGDVITTASISAKDGPRLRFLGRLGSELSVADGQESARLALVNCLAAVRAELGSLDGVAEVVRITGYVASAPDFFEQHQVVDGASELAHEVFGDDAGRHVRAAVGVAALPNNCSVGIELTVTVAD